MYSEGSQLKHAQLRGNPKCEQDVCFRTLAISPAREMSAARQRHLNATVSAPPCPPPLPYRSYMAGWLKPPI